MLIPFATGQPLSPLLLCHPVRLSWLALCVVQRRRRDFNPWRGIWDLNLTSTFALMLLRPLVFAGAVVCARSDSSTFGTYVKDKLRRGAFKLSKIPGKHNVADVLTKHVDNTTLTRLMPAMGLEEGKGRPASAPNLQQA